MAGLANIATAGDDPFAPEAPAPFSSVNTLTFHPYTSGANLDTLTFPPYALELGRCELPDPVG